MQVLDIRYCEDVQAHYCDYEKPDDWWKDDPKQESVGLDDRLKHALIGVVKLDEQFQKFAEKKSIAGDFASEYRGKAFVGHANRLAKNGQIDAALDLVFDRIGNFLVKCKFQEVDSILEDVRPERLSVDILLGLLTCTLPAKTKLSTRAALFVKVEKEIRKRGEWEEGLLSGLEN